jgi:hypothetical protein
MEPNRLIHRQQLMKSILAGSANAQPKIDLRKRSDLHRHGSKIVSHPGSYVRLPNDECPARGFFELQLERDPHPADTPPW